MQELYSEAAENVSVYISQHAYKRMRQRNGWNRKTADRMIKRIYSDGLRSDEFKGYAKRWFENRTNKSPQEECVLYGDYIYIFKEHVLMTAYPLPCREQVLRHYKK